MSPDTRSFSLTRLIWSWEMPAASIRVADDRDEMLNPTTHPPGIARSDSMFGGAVGFSWTTSSVDESLGG
jgi:hypothetical protein